MEMDDRAGRKALLKACGIERGRVLDVGMGGCGCMSAFLAKRGFDVVGIDHSTWSNRTIAVPTCRFHGNKEHTI